MMIKAQEPVFHSNRQNDAQIFYIDTFPRNTAFLKKYFIYIFIRERAHKQGGAAGR